jgi:hypothetical protein
MAAQATVVLVESEAGSGGLVIKPPRDDYGQRSGLILRPNDN